MKKRKWYTFDELHNEWMEDPKYRRVYESLQPEYEIAKQIIEARVKKKISQKELAFRMGTGQAVVSRLEGANASPSIALLKRLASALGKTLVIKFR